MRNTARLSNWSPILLNQAAVGHGFSSSYQRMVTKYATQQNFKKRVFFKKWPWTRNFSVHTNPSEIVYNGAEGARGKKLGRIRIIIFGSSSGQSRLFGLPQQILKMLCGMKSIRKETLLQNTQQSFRNPEEFLESKNKL